MAEMVYSDDGTVGEACLRFFEHLVEALTLIERPPVLDGDLQKRLERAGFEGVEAKAIKQPWGPWAKSRRQKQIGAMNMLQAETAFHAYGVAAFTRILRMDVDKADQICREGYRSVLNKNSHMHGLQYVPLSLCVCGTVIDVPCSQLCCIWTKACRPGGIG